MAIARKLGEFDYILHADRELEVDRQTIWRLRPLSWNEYQEVNRREFKQVGMESHLVGDRMATARKVLGYGLVGWQNFRDDEGTEIRFEKNNAGFSNKILDLLIPFATELSNAISDATEPSEEDAKNS